MQDPTHTETTYLYEAILAAAQKATEWRGLYAFATLDGVDHLIEDQIVHNLMENGGKVDLVVGIDAVTNRATLGRMQELEVRHANFRPRVFWNDSGRLFHPKISDFALADGGRIVVVGSGNLTPGGLMGNFEAYTVIEADQGDEVDIGALEEFLARHVDGIRRIDEEALERAAANIIRPLAVVRRGGARGRRRRTRTKPLSSVAGPRAGFDRILLAQVPAAGGRWAQVHFNAHVIQDYFRINQLDIERVYLTRVFADGTRGGVEVRRCVYSADSNRNYKIEVGAAKHLDYPDVDRPLLIFRERRLRTYDYMLLMPGEDGYGIVRALSERLPSPGGGLARPVTGLPELAEAWGDCPLLHMPEANSEEM